MKGPRNGAGRATVAALVAAFVAASCLDSRAADAGTNADFSRLVAVAISTGRAGEFPPLELVLGDGRRIERHIRFAKGAPENPLDEAELQAKVASQVEPVLGAAACARLVEAVAGLESLRDFREVVRLLAPDAGA